MTGVLLPQPMGARVLQLVPRSPRLRRIDVPGESASPMAARRSGAAGL